MPLFTADFFVEIESKPTRVVLLSGKKINIIGKYAD